MRLLPPAELKEARLRSDVSEKKNAQVIRHFGLLPPGDAGLQLPSQSFPQVRAMDNGLDGARNKQDRPKPSFDATRPEDYVEFVESL